jgi:hypothetical protein
MLVASDGCRFWEQSAGEAATGQWDLVGHSSVSHTRDGLDRVKHATDVSRRLLGILGLGSRPHQLKCKQAVRFETG